MTEVIHNAEIYPLPKWGMSCNKCFFDSGARTKKEIIAIARAHKKECTR